MVDFKVFNSLTKEISSFGHVELFDVLNDDSFRFVVKVYDLSFIDLFPSNLKFTVTKKAGFYVVEFIINTKEIKSIKNIIIA